MSQYTKSSSSSSYSAHPFTLDGGTSQTSATFDPMNFVHQMWKGFCVPPPNPDDNRTHGGDTSEERYEQHFRTADTANVTKDIPRCIDLTSQTINCKYNTAAIDHKDRPRLDSYEFDNCDCKDRDAATSMMIISHDSYDDDEFDEINEDNCGHRHDSSCKLRKDNVAVDHVVDDEKFNVHDDSMIALTSSYTNRMIRVTRGLGNFIIAILFMALTMYMIQKLQEQESPPYYHHNFYIHSKINHHESSLWRWHLK